MGLTAPILARKRAPTDHVLNPMTVTVWQPTSGRAIKLRIVITSAGSVQHTCDQAQGQGRGD